MPHAPSVLLMPRSHMHVLFAPVGANVSLIHPRKPPTSIELQVHDFRFSRVNILVRSSVFVAVLGEPTRAPRSLHAFRCPGYSSQNCFTRSRLIRMKLSGRYA